MDIKIIIGLSLLIILGLATSTTAESRVKIEPSIKTYEIIDTVVVGDAFYYSIDLTNFGPEPINDTLEVYLVNPAGRIIEDIRYYPISLEKNSSITINATGGKPNETAAFPLDVSGDYELIVNASTSIEFYRIFLVKTEQGITERYIRQPKSFTYVFDVMPRWQYLLWQESSDANLKVIETNDEMLNLTKNLKSSTVNIEIATIVMLLLAFLNIYLSVIKETGVGEKIRKVIKVLTWIILIAILVLIALVMFKSGRGV